MITDLIIPALDERANMTALFDALEPVRDRLRHVVLADNGSSDGTPEVAESRGAVVVREPRRGYGAACLEALRWLGEQRPAPEAVVFLDADLADDPAALPRVLAPLLMNEADIVIGSRIRLAEPGALNAVQRFGNGLACSLIALLTGRRYRDLGPFRAARWETLLALDMTDRTWGWTVELQMKAALARLRLVEVDVPYRTRRAGRSKISGTIRGVVTAGSKIIATIIVLWWRRAEVVRKSDEATSGRSDGGGVAGTA